MCARIAMPRIIKELNSVHLVDQLFRKLVQIAKHQFQWNQSFVQNVVKILKKPKKKLVRIARLHLQKM